MPTSESIVYVFDDFTDTKPILMGRLYVENVDGGQNYSFGFDPSWLRVNRDVAPLDARLVYDTGRQYCAPGELFALFMDSFPERLGRRLIESQEKVWARSEGRDPRKNSRADYLLRVCDKTRCGGLRFKVEPAGPFLGNDLSACIARESALPDLECRFRDYENKTVSDLDACGAWLVETGAFLCGSRPKACVRDCAGKLWIAKFPSTKDRFDIGAWEMVTHDLAALCGLDVPEAKLMRNSSHGSTFLTKRFDRDGEKRIHFATALTLLEKPETELGEYRVSFIDVARFIREHGCAVKSDLPELWKRMLFDLAVRNTDNYLRNQAFLFSGKGWKLAPLFDALPDASGEPLSLGLSRKEGDFTVSDALACAPDFDVTAPDAQRIAETILLTVEANWEKLAERHGLTREAIETMRPAFSQTA